MVMRKELEPDWETVERLYPIITALIEKYTEYCDKNGDEELVEYKKLESKLCEMTGKDISQYNLWEWWEGEGLEVLSFKISLPDPNVLQDISKEELTDIVLKIKTGIKLNSEDNLRNTFSCYLGDFYHKMLKQTFKKYRPEYFNRQKGIDGKCFEYTAEEIVEKVWG